MGVESKGFFSLVISGKNRNKMVYMPGLPIKTWLSLRDTGTGLFVYEVDKEFRIVKTDKFVVMAKDIEHVHVLINPNG